MRLLLLSHAPDDPDAGASRVYHLLTDGLRDRGHDVVVRHLDDMTDWTTGLRHRVLSRAAMPRIVSRTGARLVDGVDVVMSSSGMAYPLFRDLARRSIRPALVNHVHGFATYDDLANLTERTLGHYRPNLVSQLLTAPAQRRWSEAGVRFGDLTIVQNLRDLDRATESGARVELIPCGIHPDLFEHTTDDVERTPFSVLWFGSWEPRKGAAYVPRALRILRSQIPEATFTIGGTGLDAATLLAKFAPEDRDAVTVLPRITRAEHATLLSRTSVFLFPSLSEGFGLALLEAMSLGMAAVTSSTAFGGDYLTSGHDAVVVPVTGEHIGRALVDLMGDPAALERIRRNGQALARTFTADRMVEGYERAFEAVVADRRALKV